MLTLYSLPGSHGIPSHSPFCVKAMCLLQMAGTDWQPEYRTDTNGMPYGKLPVTGLEDGTLLPESHNLQRLLTDRGADFFVGLSPVQKGQARAIQQMAEESLRLGLVYERWLNDDTWPVMRDLFFGSVPEALRSAVSDEVRAMVRAGLMGHGFARMSEDHRLAQLQDDVTAVEAMLWSGPFLFGEAPTAADASLVPVLDMLAHLPVETAVRRMVADQTRLMEYVHAGRAAMYPKLEDAQPS